MIGQIVGGQKLLSKLGEGGMGVVYRGRDETLGRLTAVKMLHPQFSQQTEIVERFFNEARAAAALRHIGIIEVYSFGHHTDGAAFLVMELLEGDSLEARVAARRTLAPSEAVRITKHVCSALAAAHEKEIIHRDLKPENIYLIPDPDFPGGERIKILDFGIAKLSGDGASQVKTRAGAVFGTPEYMAPEQCRGAANVDARADLYAIGCILFQMLCGRAPFAGSSVGEIIAAQIRDEPPRPRELDPSIPPAIEAIVLRLLAKNPDERFPSAKALRAALDELDLPPRAVAASPASKLEQGLASTLPAITGATPAPSTTLSAAAGEARAVGPARSVPQRFPRRPLYVLGGLVAAGVAAGVIVATTRTAPEPGSEQLLGQFTRRPASGIELDGFSLGDTYSTLFARPPYDRPCDDDPVDAAKTMRAMVYGGTECRGNTFAEGTSLVVFIPNRQSGEEFEVPITAVAWLGGTYFDARGNFGLAIGAHRAEVRARLGEPSTSFETERTSLTVEVYDGDLYAIFDGEIAAGYAIGPLPTALREGDEHWSAVGQMYARYTRRVTSLSPQQLRQQCEVLFDKVIGLVRADPAQAARADELVAERAEAIDSCASKANAENLACGMAAKTYAEFRLCERDLD